MVQQQKAVLHLTHTDPRSDSRILKEMTVANLFESFSVYGIGIPDSLSRNHSLPDEFQFFLLDDEEATIQVEPSFSLRVTNWLKQRLGYLWWPIEFDYKLRKILRAKKLPERIEIIHVHDYQALFAGVRLKRKTGAKLIYDAHELESNMNGRGARDSFVVRRGERRFWKHVDGFITVSESIRNYYFSHHPAVPSEVVLNSPNPRKDWKGAGDFVSLRRLLGIPPEEKLFVYLGYLYPGRGIKLILEAANDLPKNYHVAFVGSGELEIDIKASPLFDSRVHLVEPVDQELVVPFIADADAGFCLIQPISLSDYYSLPNKLFECLFAGLPVVGSRLPEIESILQRYRAGCLTSFDIEDIKMAAIEVVSNDFRISQSAIEELSWATQVRKVQSLYSRLLVEAPTNLSSTGNPGRNEHGGGSRQN